MIIFWLTCAAFVAIALAFVIPPLLPGRPKNPPDDVKEANIAVYRDQLSELQADLQNGIISQEQYQQDSDEIKRRVLDEASAIGNRPESKPVETTGRGAAYAIAILVPLIALAVYWGVGNPGAMSAASAGPVRAPSAGGPQANALRSQQDIEASVAALARRMEQSPGDAAGWAMLGRSYVSLEKFSEANGAYEKAMSLKPDDADLWADYAFAMGMANGRNLTGRPGEMIKKALALDPENPKALELAGSAAFEARNYKDAINYWKRLLEKTPRDSELGRALLERIEQAEAESGKK